MNRSVHSRVFLCDQSLKDFHGHCYAYFAPIRNVLKAGGIEAVIVGHRSTDAELKTLGVLAAFSAMADERDTGGRRSTDPAAVAEAVRATHEAKIRGDLDELDRSLAFSDRDVLVFNTVRQWQILGIVRWLEYGRVSARCPRIVIVLHYTGQPAPHEPDPASALYREAFEAVERSTRRDRVALWTDASTLVDEFAAQTTQSVRLAPFPHTAHSARRPWNGERTLRICYAGEARIEKGFHLLPYLAERLLASDLIPAVELHVQTSINNQDQSFFREANSLLRAAPNVTTYPDAFSPSDFTDFLRNADVLLIPYQRMYYHRQTSGIFAEARSLGVPVVVTRGTWMARELAGLGGETCDPDDILSLVSATEAVCRDYQRYEREAAEQTLSWAALHSPERWVDLLDVA